MNDACFVETQGTVTVGVEDGGSDLLSLQRGGEVVSAVFMLRSLFLEMRFSLTKTLLRTLEIELGTQDPPHHLCHL